MCMSTDIFQVTAYHGSGCRIDSFDYAFTGIGNDQNGSGFYFTSNIEEAIAYCSNTINGLEKPGGMSNPTVHMAHLSFNRLLDSQSEAELQYANVVSIIRRSPRLDECLENWDEVTDATRERVIAMAAKAYTQKEGEGPLIKRLFALANDFYGADTKAFNEAVRDVLGFDGVIERFEEKTHFVAFFPEQINVVARWSLEEARRMLDGIHPVEGAPRPADRPRP